MIASPSHSGLLLTCFYGDPAMSLSFESEAVRAHLKGLQDTISRLAGNSAHCKNWCVTVTAILLRLSLDKQVKAAMPLTILPIIAFGLLDTYYLSLERKIRNIYRAFADKIRGSSTTEGSAEALLFHFGGTKTDASFIACLRSSSIWIFYPGLLFLAALDSSTRLSCFSMA